MITRRPGDGPTPGRPTTTAETAEAAAARVKYQYRKLIASGALRLDRRAATPLVGPDCAYHLYAWERGRRGPRRPGS